MVRVSGSLGQAPDPWFYISSLHSYSGTIQPRQYAAQAFYVLSFPSFIWYMLYNIMVMTALMI